MSKKSNRPQQRPTPTNRGGLPKQQKNIAPQSAKASATTKKNSQKLITDLLIVAGIAIITYLFLQVCLENQFTNWDEEGYLDKDPFIRDVSWEGIKKMFAIGRDSYVMGNYHPITVLSYAIEYSYVHLQPWLYHLDSLLIHVLNTAVVYWFTKKLSGRTVAAAITALLFGLHPMHVESVAWVPGRKDVLFGFFYIVSCISYLYYIRTNTSKKWLPYMLCLLLYFCSILSKPVAVTLPVALLLIDYLEKRKWNYGILLEKIPYFVLSIIFGIISVKAQGVFGAIGKQNIHYNLIQKCVFACYSLITYLWKAVIPAGMSNFYPFPDVLHGGLAIGYYLYPAGLILLVLAIWFFARKNRVVVFGFLFFLVNLVLLLQFVQVGGAIMADRYAYISYFGLFYIAGWYVSNYFVPGAKKQLGYMVLSAALVFSLVMGYVANQRCKVWYDGFSMWRDEIEKHPHDAANAYNNLGFKYFTKYSEATNPQQKKIYYDSASYLLRMAIQIVPEFVNPYVSLGELYRTAGKFDSAKAYYFKALRIEPNEQNAFLSLGIMYSMTRVLDSAGIYYRKALAIQPFWAEAHGDFANYFDMTGNLDSALNQYNIALKQNPDVFGPYLNRGGCLQRKGRCDEAMKDFERAIELNPDYGQTYYLRSHCERDKGRKDLALKDVEKATALGFTDIDQNYLAELKR